MRRLKAAIVAAAAIAGATLIGAAPSPAETTLGWHWATSTLWVYDGTSQPVWKVAEAADEWSRNTGITLRMTDTAAAAQVTVVETDVPADNGDALGVANYPYRADGVASGQCRIELARWLPAWAPLTAEHTAIHEIGHCLGLAHDDAAPKSVMESHVRVGDGFTKPQAADLRALRSIYQ